MIRLHLVLLLIVMLFNLNLNAQISGPENFDYPHEAIENQIQGRVYVTFTALPTGEILDSTIQIAKGLGYGLDEIAVEAVKNAPPLGRNSITKLKIDEPTKYALPIVFTIEPQHWANYYYQKASMEQKSGNHNRAIILYSDAIPYLNGEPKYYYGLYISHIELGNMKKACKYLKKAKKLDRSYKSEWVEKCK